MGKKRRRIATQKALISTLENGELGDMAEEKKGERFFACYLLTSLCPRFKGQTYIGFTVNPRRRIRQHNGEIGSGARRTKRKRPWEMVLCIYGFPTNVAALQFERAWQHPVKSLAVRAAAASFKPVSGLANKIKLAHAMLTLPAWRSLNLTMNFFSTKYQMYTSGCPTLPDQMETQVCSMDKLPCYKGNARVTDELEGDEECYFGGSFQASPTRQSMGLMRTVDDSWSNHYSSEAKVCIQQMSQNDDSSCEISERSDETWRELLRS